MKAYLESLTAYNTWANTKILRGIEAAGEEKARLVQKSSFPTILTTLLHIIDAQHIWMMRLRGESISGWPGKDFSGTLAEACALLVESSRQFEDLVRKTPAGDFTLEIAYRNIKGVPFRNSVEQIVAHVMNHSTYHRGQLVTLLRGSGYEAVEATDLIAFYREEPGEPSA